MVRNAPRISVDEVVCKKDLKEAVGGVLELDAEVHCQDGSYSERSPIAGKA